MKLLSIYGSSRKNGNSEAIGKLMLRELEPSDYHEIHLLNYHIEPITDQRHARDGFDPINDDFETLAKKVMEHEALLFITPLYWYGMSGHLKTFVDRFSQCLRNDNYDFREIMKNKKMYVIVVGGPSAPNKALPLIQQFQLIAEFFEMEFAGYMIGKGVKPLEILEDEDSLVAARQLAKKIKVDLSEEQTTKQSSH